MMENQKNEKVTVLIIGATGRIGSYIVKELDANSEGINVRLSSTKQSVVDAWVQEEREAVVLDLNMPETFPATLHAVQRIFLLTGYTLDMLHQSKALVDAAVDAGVKHIVHLGVFTSRRDLIPHFIWHDMIENYIESSGLFWTHLHPNSIADSTLDVEPSIQQSESFTVYSGNAKQGWVFASDIGAVAAAVLREGPIKHHAANYYLSTEVLTGPEIAEILSKASGKDIRCSVQNPASLKEIISQIPDISQQAYMESAYVFMGLAKEGKMEAQCVVKDDVKTLLGRPGLTIAEWAKQQLS